MSTVVDVADKSKLAVPWFTPMVKDQRSHGLSVHLIGFLGHLQINHLLPFRITDAQATGVNHIVASIHGLFNECADEGPIPSIFYLQLHSHWGEIKSHYLISFPECLVSGKVFDMVKFRFLPVGLTHSDIYQTFSTTSRQRDKFDAITLEDVHTAFSNCYNEHTVV